MFKHKKGMSLDTVAPVVIILVVIAIVIGLGSTILEQFRAQNCASSATGNYYNISDATCRATGGALATAFNYGYNATVYGQQGLNTFASFQPTIAIVVVSGVILGIIGAVLLQNKME